MKKLVFLFSAVLIAAFASAQTDFSGSWKLNKSKSTLNDQFSMAPNEIIIEQDGNLLKVEKHSSFQGNSYTTNDEFTLDGKESVNDGWQGSKKKSTAVWSDDKSTLTITSKIPIQNGEEMSISEIYKMDGANMTLESSASSSWGDLEETMFYDKQ